MKKYFTKNYWKMQLFFWLGIGRPLNILEIRELNVETEKEVFVLYSQNDSVIKVVLYEKINGIVISKSCLSKQAKWIEMEEMSPTPKECIFKFGTNYQ